MFEFSQFYPADYEHGRGFVADLDRFFSKLPAGWNYGVELRSQGFNPTTSQFSAVTELSMSSTTGRGWRRWDSRWLWRAVKLQMLVSVCDSWHCTAGRNTPRKEKSAGESHTIKTHQRPASHTAGESKRWRMETRKTATRQRRCPLRQRKRKSTVPPTIRTAWAAALHSTIRC